MIINYHFRMNSARIEFMSTAAKVKAMNLIGTILKDNRIDVSLFLFYFRKVIL